jgi:hypothetical protein
MCYKKWVNIQFVLKDNSSTLFLSTTNRQMRPRNVEKADLIIN